MGLYAIKPAFVAGLRPVEELVVAREVSANALTGAALGVAALTAGAIVAGGVVDPRWWLAVAPLSLVRMTLNVLDGAVARRTGTSTTTGAVLNELGDRVADVATLTACVVVATPVLALVAALAAVLTSFVAVTAQAVIGERSTAGPMGKADRVLVLSLAGLLAAWSPAHLDEVWAGWMWDGALAIVVAGAAASIVIRARGLMTQAAKRDAVADRGGVA